MGTRFSSQQPVPEVDLSQKTIIVTGANTGIGYEAAKTFAQLGAKVIVACRSEAKANEAIERMKREHGEEKADDKRSKVKIKADDLDVEFMTLDLSSLASTMSFVEAFKAKGLPLHVLVCNAGMAFGGDITTDDGFEIHFQVNYLSHFLLILHLLPVLKTSGANARIVLVSSLAYRNVSWKEDDMQAVNKKQLIKYGNSKLYQIMQMFSLAERLEGSGIGVFSLHPGYVDTDIGKRENQQISRPLKFIGGTASSMIGRKSFEGALSTIHAAANPEYDGKTAIYFENAKPASLKTSLPTFHNIRNMAFSKQQAVSEEVVQLSKANNGFTLHLYQTLQDERRGQNLFFSPLSISTALAMTHLGARGDTATQIADVFHFNQVQNDQLHGAFKELNNLLYQTGSSYKLHAANRLYGKSGYNFVQSFLDGTGSYYRASIEAVDNFASPEAAKSINDWVSKQTEGKITNLIAPRVLDALTRLVLVNAIYFKGNWETKFREENTKQDTFKVMDERKKVPVRLMIQEKNFPLAIDKTNDCLVLEMPYAGRNMSLLIGLPNKDDGLSQLESNVSAHILQSWDTNLLSRKVTVMLPKFKLEAEFQLKRALKEMGMSDAFDDNKANFEGISGDRELFISDVIHKAFVEVNEGGSEAAAATALVIGGGCALPRKPEKPIIFRADHPFLFMIRHRPTKSVLFIGRMMDPS